MRKWLCFDCIYGEKKIAHAETSNYLKPLFIHGKLMQVKINGNSLIFDCGKQGKYIRKVMCECKFYQNTNLFYVPPHPEFLPFIPYDNSCKNCGGTGYVIEKHYLHTKERYERKTCEICSGKGILKKVVKINS